MAKCVPERLPLKRQVIVQLDDAVSGDTIIASNSSSYTCAEILDGLELKNEKHMLSAHSCE